MFHCSILFSRTNLFYFFILKETSLYEKVEQMDRNFLEMERHRLEMDRNFLEMERHRLETERHRLETDQILHTLLQNTHDFPTLAVILPLDTGDALMVSCRLVFMCSHTRELVPCGDTEEKNGFVFSRTREWVQKVAPYVQYGLNFLGDKINDSILDKLFPNQSMLQAAIKSAQSLVGAPISESSEVHLRQHCVGRRFTSSLRRHESVFGRQGY